MELSKNEETRRAAYFAADDATRKEMREAYERQITAELTQAREEFIADTSTRLMPKDIYDTAVGTAWRQPTTEAAQNVLDNAGIDIDLTGDSH